MLTKVQLRPVVLAMAHFHLKFLVCGKTGVGKSSLINSLLGREVCKVVDPGFEGGSLEPCTLKVEEFHLDINGIAVTVFDSPGLQDGTDNEEKYLLEMYDKCKDVDLVIYCVDMTISRYAITEIRSAELLTQKFGPNFWKRCVFVMTKANCVRAPSRERGAGAERDYHQRLYTNLSRKFRNHLIEQGVPRSIANNIPAVAAGHYDPSIDDNNPLSERYVWYVSDKTKPQLFHFFHKREDEEPSNCRVDFLTELWVTCLETACQHSQSSGALFVAVTRHERINVQQGGTAEAYFNELIQKEIKSIYQQSGYVEEMIHNGCKSAPFAASMYLGKNQVGRVHSALSPRRHNIMSVSITAAGAIAGAVAGKGYGPLGMTIGFLIGVAIGQCASIIRKRFGIKSVGVGGACAIGGVLLGTYGPVGKAAGPLMGAAVGGCVGLAIGLCLAWLTAHEQ